MTYTQTFAARLPGSERVLDKQSRVSIAHDAHAHQDLVCEL